MTWSDAARKASAEARRRKSGGKSKVRASGQETYAQAKARARRGTPGNPTGDRPVPDLGRRYNSPNADRSTWQR